MRVFDDFKLKLADQNGYPDWATMIRTRTPEQVISLLESVGDLMAEYYTDSKTRFVDEQDESFTQQKNVAKVVSGFMPLYSPPAPEIYVAVLNNKTGDIGIGRKTFYGIGGKWTHYALLPPGDYKQRKSMPDKEHEEQLTTIDYERDTGNNTTTDE